ncbi:MAG: hypothetical protein MJ210_03285 [Alphaproteobacteria bacterium]|nr:hypothetical protein [Alphaproteobacteria bacterium]
MDKLQQVRDFLEETIKEKGISLNALSLRLGKNSTYLFHFIKRHSPKRLDETVRHQLAQILDVDEQRLCDFPLEQHLIQDKLSTLSNFFNLSKEKTEDLIAIDVIDMEGAYHGRFEDIKNNVIGKEFMSSSVYSLCTASNPKNIKIIRATGETMAPTINSGDFLWVDLSYKNIISDGIYLINTQNDAIFRRVQVNPFDNSLEISADNKSYKSFTIKEANDLEVCGKVIFLSTKL